MRNLILASVVAVLSVTITAPASAASFDLQGDAPTTMGGVSPFALSVDPSTDRVFHSAGEQGGWIVSTCAVGGVCTDRSLSPDFGSDYTQVTLPDGSQRAYFVLPDPTGAKELATASVTYMDGVPQLGEITRLGISAAPQERAWGVPDSVVTPDGRVRLYWVESGSASSAASGDFRPSPAQRRCLVNALGAKRVQQVASGTKVTGKIKKVLRKCGVPVSAVGSQAGGGSNEVIVSATSTDATGTSFARDPGFRTTGGYVDSAVIQAKAGDWVMLVSTGPGTPPQRLFSATSADGITWTIDKKPLTASNVNSLDPTAVQTGANSWRVYYAQAPKATPFSGHVIHVATLTR